MYTRTDMIQEEKGRMEVFRVYDIGNITKNNKTNIIIAI